MTGWALLVRLSAIVAAAVTWLLWTAGPAAACTVTYQAGPGGAVCGGAVPAVAAGAVAAAALAGVGAAVALAARGGSAVRDLENLDRELGPSEGEIAFRDDVVRRLNAGDPAVMKLYRTGGQGQGTVPRVRVDAKISPYPLPVVERGADDRYRLKDDRAPEAIRAVFRGGVYRHDRSGLAPETLAEADWLTHGRAGNLKNLREARQTVKGTPVPDSRFGTDRPLDEVDRSAFGFLATVWGEKLGEYAGVHAASTHLAQLFPGGVLERLLAGELGGAGTLDDIYRVRGPGGTVGMVVLETKGPDAPLGARNVGDLRYEQGHPEYLRSVIGQMRDSGRFGAVPQELENALDAGTLAYFSVRALVTESGGLAHTDMTATKLDELWREVDEAVRAAREERPGITADEVARLHRELRTAAVHGTAVYGGYELRQFDIGLDWP